MSSNVPPNSGESSGTAYRGAASAGSAGSTGSIGSAGDPGALEAAVDAALGKLDLAAKVRLLTGANFWALYPAPEAGLRPIVVSDGPAGVKGDADDASSTTTSLPSPTALAASWDEELVGELGELLAGEARRKGVDVLLGPTINLHRSPVGGRHFEAFSEDPLLTGRIATAYVRGLQSRGVGGCPKHYIANDAETDRHTVSNVVADRPLHELYLAPFERAITEGGAWTTMASYNRVNGIQMTESPLLADPLKERWGFDGVVMSDWFATHSTVPSARGALDLVMPGPVGPWGDALLDAVRAGEVAEAAIDEKVRRILRLAGRVGALEGIPAATPVATRARQTEVDALVRRASAAGTVLLRNDGVLPLDPGSLRSIALLGPNAQVAPSQGGGSANLRPEHAVTPLDGLRAALPDGVEVLTSPADRGLQGVQIVTPSQVTLPPEAGDGAGSPGILVRFLDADGSERDREIQKDGEFHWVGSPKVLGRPVLEFSTLVMPDVDGVHEIAFAVRGHVRIWVDGALVLDETVMPEPGADLDRVWGNPPFHRAPIAMTAGRPAAVRVVWEKFYDENAAFPRLGLVRPSLTQTEALERAESLARSADVVIVAVGTTKEIESEGHDRLSLSLPPEQDELVRRVAAANPRTVVVVQAGAPVEMPWREDVAAILLTWFPGQEAGNALADMLLGAAEPGGRLPTSWPAAMSDAPILNTQPSNGELRYDEGIHIGYRAWLRRGHPEPAFPFGFGLGYTRWEYLTAAGSGSPDAPAVRVRLRNAGDRPGREVVQVYLSRPDSTVERPVRWLAGFAGVVAAPGEVVEVEIAVDRWALRHWDVAADGGRGGWSVEPGRFDVGVGPNVLELPLRVSIEVAG